MVDYAEQMLKDENELLTKENEDLKRQLEQLRSDKEPKSWKGQRTVRFDLESEQQETEEPVLQMEVQKLLQENFELKEEVKQLREVYEQERWKLREVMNENSDLQLKVSAESLKAKELKLKFKTQKAKETELQETITSLQVRFY